MIMIFPSEIGPQSILLHDIEEWFSGVRSICQVIEIIDLYQLQRSNTSKHALFPQPFDHSIPAPSIGDGLH